MKKIMSTLLISAVALLACSLQAQVIKTYMSEDFQSQTLSDSKWDLQNSVPIVAGAQPEYVYMLNDGSSIWGAWGYDKNGQLINGGLTDKLDGTYRLTTKASKMEEATNIVSLDVMYLGSVSGVAANRMFSIQARIGTSGEWETIDSIYQFQNGMQGKLTIVLDEKFAGKDNVQLSFAFSNKHNDWSAFLFLIDNISFAAYEQKPVIKGNVFSPYFTAASLESSIDFQLNITNTGAVNVASVEYAYSINGKDARTITDTTKFAALFGAARITLPVNLNDAAFGANRLKIWPAKVNGEAYETTAEDTISHTFTLVDESKLSDNFVPVLEGFTSSTCGYCAPMNSALNPVLKELQEAGEINAVKYQMNFPGAGDPYYISSNGTRMNYYANLLNWEYLSVPTPIYNGKENIYDYGGKTYNDLANQMKANAKADHAKKAVMELNITKASVNTTTGELEFEVSGRSHVDVQAYMLVLILEKKTTGNKRSNGETEFFHVNMAAPFGANGKVIRLQTDSTFTISGSVADMHKTHMEEPEDLEILCFVQTMPSQGATILQSVSADVQISNVANEDRLAAAISVYPNPAKNNVSIKGLDNADVRVFDMTGRMVYSQKTAMESLEINLSRFTAGTYMIRIEQNGNTIHKKLVVTK